MVFFVLHRFMRIQLNAICLIESMTCSSIFYIYPSLADVKCDSRTSELLPTQVAENIKLVLAQVMLPV